jgi:predicted transcriptional regulator
MNNPPEAAPPSPAEARPEPTGRSREYIDGLAGRIAGKLGLEPGDDLKPVVERLGGKVTVRPWNEPRSDGSIYVHGPEKFEIFLSPFTGPLRDRFTIAHELGHYFLHSLVGQNPIRINREGNDRTEWEANWFAAGFLMPEDKFKQKWEEFEHRVEPMAAHFVVSTQTVRIRSQILGLQGAD